MTPQQEVREREFDLNRRDFFTLASGAAAGISAIGFGLPAAEAAEKPTYGGSIKIGLRSDIPRLDPHPFYPPYPTSNAMSLIYNGMTEADYDLNVVPALAHAWETSKDGLTWTWHIRKDVTFHNGRPMTAEDVKANVERVLDPKIGALVRGELEIIDTMELMDKYTLRMQLKDKYYPLPAMLTNRWVPIIDPQAFDTVKQHPIGTGPFKFVSWKRLHTTEMARHETYWEKDAEGNALPYLDEIIGKPLADDTVRLTALRTGEVDLIDNMHYRDQDRFLEQWGQEYDTYQIKALGTLWMFFNCQRPPFNDVRVRRAAAMALDKKAIFDKTLFGHGEIMDQFYTEPAPWRLQGVPKLERNVPEAKRLLKEAGVKPGTQITMVTFVRYNYLKEGAQIFQQNLREIGIVADLQIIDSGPLQAVRAKRDYDVLGLGSAYRMDPHEYYYKEMSSKSAAAANYGGWVNPVYDQLIDDASRTPDKEERKRLYVEAEKLIHEEAPKVRSISAYNLSAWRKAVRGYRPNLAGNMTYNAGGFRNTWLAQS
jgi:peptide/nickel transport system substrate-binding protein